jgi:hypothetical protein
MRPRGDPPSPEACRPKDSGFRQFKILHRWSEQGPRNRHGVAVWSTSRSRSVRWLSNFEVCDRQIEPGSAVDLGKGLQLPAFRRPFDLERVALDRIDIDIEIAFDGERSHPLAPRCRMSPSGSRGPDGVQPVSSRNSRRAATAASSPSSISPLGIDQAPSSLFR